MSANPLLFFLMCLKEDEEVNSLIKREITARNFFLLCDSPAARSSPWVQKEREFVLSLKDRKVHELDLDWPWERQKGVIHDTLRSATTFLNYAFKDRDRVHPYIEFLAANDFAVFEPSSDIPSGASWVDALDTAIERAVTGYFFTFLSQGWLHSAWAHKEIERFLALAEGAQGARRPILVALDPLPLLARDLPPALRDMQILDFSGGSVVENQRRLLEAVDLRRRTDGA